MSNTSKARQLRRDQTKPESIFWTTVRNREFLGTKWKRQVPIDRFIVDFLCEDEKLIVELDGGQHNEDAAIVYDQQRTQILEQYGYRVVRFWNNDITENLDGVLRILQQSIGQSSPHPAAADAARTSPQGEDNKVENQLADRKMIHAD